MKVARTVLRRVGAGNCSRLSDRHEPNTVAGTTENAYQYNGKELNSDFGLDWLDYGARWYDASIARWSAVDPLAEMYNSLSSYAYVSNNPSNSIDVNGEAIYFVVGGNTYKFGHIPDMIKLEKNAPKLASALMALLHTESGSELIYKYSDSSTDDIYIAMDILRRDAGAVTGHARKGSNSIEIASDEHKIEETAFTNQFKGIKTDIDKDRHFILMNRDYLYNLGHFKYKNTNAYDHAETIYHEIYSHVKYYHLMKAAMDRTRVGTDARTRATNAAYEKQHHIYGVPHDDNAAMISGKKKARDGSPASKIIRELKDNQSKGIKDMSPNTNRDPYNLRIHSIHNENLFWMQKNRFDRIPKA